MSDDRSKDTVDGAGAAANGISRRQMLHLLQAGGAAAVFGELIPTADPADAAEVEPSASTTPTPTKTFETTLRRRADQLNLTIEFWNLRLDTSTGTPRLMRVVNASSYIVVQFQPLHLADQAFFKSGASVPQEPGAPPTPGSEVPAAPPVKAMLAHRSRLAFLVPAGLLPLPFTTEAILGWVDMLPRVVPSAVPPLGRLDALPNVSLRAPTASETALELPWRLQLSPSARSAWAHADDPVTHAGITELWHTRLGVRAFDSHGTPITDERNATLRTLRAVWSLDPNFVNTVKSNSPPSSLANDAPFRMSLTARDRLDIVRLSADWKLAQARPGVTTRKRRGKNFRPEPMSVERMMLSSLGGWLHSAFDNELDFRSGVYNSSLLQWRHVAAQGRDSYARIVRKGYLFPFGFKAALIKVTERMFDHIGDQTAQPKGGYLRQRVFIVVQQHERTYAGDASFPYSGRRLPFRSLVCTTRSTPDLDAPTVYAAPLSKNEVFAPRFAGKLFTFHFRGTDWAGVEHTFSAPVVWVDDTRAYELANVGTIITKYNHTLSQTNPPLPGPADKVPFKQQRLAFATPTKPGDTTWPVSTISFAATAPVAGYSPNAFAGVSKPAFYPTMFDAVLDMPELSTISGKNVAGPTMEYYTRYLTSGFGGNNKGEVVLTRPAAASKSKLGIGARSGGGMVTPSLDINGLSRKIGPTGNADDTGDGKFSPDKFLDSGAKILGGVALVKVIGAVADILTDSGKSKTLVIKSERESGPNRVVTKIDWKPKIVAGPFNPDLILFAPDGPPDDNQAVCEINAELVANLDDPSASTYRVDGRIEKVVLLLFGGNEDGSAGELTFIRVPVTKLTFKAGTLVKDNTHVDLGDITFHGPLEFVEKLSELMAFGDGSGLKIDADGAGIRITLKVALPDITVGVMSITNMAINIGLTIPFDGSPVQFRFAFCSRENPFTITVWIFGGGGFVGLIVTVKGLELLEFSFEFGGGFAIDLVVASGKVEVKAGIYFKIETKHEGGKDIQSCLIEAYIRINGSVNVLGLITASIELYLSLTYTDPPGDLVGEARMTITIDLLIFSASVEVKCKKTLKKGGGGNGGFANNTAGNVADSPEMVALAPPPIDGKATLSDLLTEAQFEQYLQSFVTV